MHIYFGICVFVYMRYAWECRSSTKRLDALVLALQNIKSQVFKPLDINEMTARTMNIIQIKCKSCTTVRRTMSEQGE